MPAPPSPSGIVSVRCQTCGAEITFEPHLKATRCPYCDSPAVVDRPPSPDRPQPDFAVGFAIDQERARAAVRRFVGRSSVLAPRGFKRAAIESIRGLYLPAYLYNALARSRWKCVIGEDYVTTETYMTTDSKGRTVMRTRTVKKTEHRRLAGDFEAYLVDVIVTASSGLSNDELQSIEPFDLRGLARYDPAVLSGWIAEEPSRGKEESLAEARSEAWRWVGRRLNRFMPGDSHHGLEHDTRLEDEDLGLCLLPVWVFAARYDPDRPPVRILVNGQTGAVAGRVPRSAARVALLVLAFLAAALLVALAVAGAWGIHP